MFMSRRSAPKNQKWPAPRVLPADEAFPAAWILECTERSLANLGLETIDVQQFHVWSTMGGPGRLDGRIERLRSQGKIRYFGVSINDHEPATRCACQLGVVDSVQVILQTSSTRAPRKSFPGSRGRKRRCHSQGTFDEGALTGKINPGTEFPKATGATAISAATEDNRSPNASRPSPKTSIVPSNASPK